MALDNAGATRRLMARLDEFAQFTDEPGRLTRLYLSPSYRGACERLAEWIREAGLEPEIDPAGNVHARYEGRQARAPALMVGSHVDTVRDAGRYDGNLGALAALAVVDEEGVRFPTTMTGSRALAGLVPADALGKRDADGTTLREALTKFGGDP